MFGPQIYLPKCISEELKRKTNIKWLQLKQNNTSACEELKTTKLNILNLEKIDFMTRHKLCTQRKALLPYLVDRIYL